MVKSVRMAGWGLGWQSVLTFQVAFKLSSFPEVWRFQCHRTQKPKYPTPQA